MKRADKIKDMKMPAKPAAESEAALDLESLGSEPEMEEGSPEEESAESPEIEASESPLDEISDDDLVAEMKKRGLIDDSDMPEEAPAPDEMA